MSEITLMGHIYLSKILQMLGEHLFMSDALGCYNCIILPIYAIICYIASFTKKNRNKIVK